MANVDTVAIRKLMIDRGHKTIKSLANAAGVDRYTLGKVLESKKNPSFDMMQKIVSALDIPAGDAGEIFFNRNLLDK